MVARRSAALLTRLGERRDIAGYRTGQKWCAHGEFNPDARRRRLLKPLCIAVPPYARITPTAVFATAASELPAFRYQNLVGRKMVAATGMQPASPKANAPKAFVFSVFHHTAKIIPTARLARAIPKATGSRPVVYAFHHAGVIIAIGDKPGLSGIADKVEPPRGCAPRYHPYRGRASLSMRWWHYRDFMAHDGRDPLARTSPRRVETKRWKEVAVLPRPVVAYETSALVGGPPVFPFVGR